MLLAARAAAQRAGAPLSQQDEAWLSGVCARAVLPACAHGEPDTLRHARSALPQQLRAALGEARGEVALGDAATLLLQALLAARPTLRRASAPAVPRAASVVCAEALALYARGGAACGDFARAWAAAGAPAPAAPSQLRLLPVRPWLVAGTLRADGDGLRLEDGAGSSIQMVMIDAHAAAALLDRFVLVSRWALPPAPHGPPVLEAHALLPLEHYSCSVADPPGKRVAGAVVAVSPVLRVQAQAPFCVVVRFSCDSGAAVHR
jgi:hypothetical protein